YALAEASGAARKSARSEGPSRINRFASLRGLSGAERERARSGAESERNRAVLLRGTGSLSTGRNPMTTPEHDHADDHGHANDNDNDQHKPAGRAVAPAPAGGALVSLAALGAALNKVDTASVIGRSGLPMLSSKREGDG